MPYILSYTAPRKIVIMPHHGCRLFGTFIALLILSGDVVGDENVSVFDKKALPVNVIWSYSASAYVRPNILILSVYNI